MKIEEYFQEQLKVLVEQSTKALEEAAGNIYTDMLPHMENDLECNISWRTRRCLSNIISGKYELRDGILVVLDDNFIETRIPFSQEYSGIAEKLFQQFRDDIVNNEIKRLEKEVEYLRNLRYN